MCSIVFQYCHLHKFNDRKSARDHPSWTMQKHPWHVRWQNPPLFCAWNDVSFWTKSGVGWPNPFDFLLNFKNLNLLFLLIRKKSPKRISISSPGECSTFSHTATAAPGDRSHAAAPRHLPNPSPPVRGYWCAATRHDAETRQAAPLRRSVTPWLVLRQGCFQCIQQIWVSWDPHSKMEKHGNNIKQWCFLNWLPNTNKFYKCCKGTNTQGTNI